MAKYVTGTTVTNLTTGKKEVIRDIGVYMEANNIGFGDIPVELAPEVLDRLAAAHGLLTDRVVKRNGSLSEPSTGLQSSAERTKAALQQAHPTPTGHQLRELADNNP